MAGRGSTGPDAGTSRSPARCHHRHQKKAGTHHPARLIRHARAARHSAAPLLLHGITRARCHCTRCMPHAACSSFTRQAPQHTPLLFAQHSCNRPQLMPLCDGICMHVLASSAAVAVRSRLAFLRCKQHHSAAPWPRLTTDEPRLALMKKHYRLQLQHWSFSPRCSGAAHSLHGCLATTATPTAPSDALSTQHRWPCIPDTPSITTTRPAATKPATKPATTKPAPSPSPHPSSIPPPSLHPHSSLTPRSPWASAPASGSSSGSAAGC